ncbi:hypothetical protein BJX61DRAFT_148571 [Aspergillus egyptiacus]|nr:hypothetical protein BJX61DRAFT_148571 [Aspergillus egyptiacus]
MLQTYPSSGTESYTVPTNEQKRPEVEFSWMQGTCLRACSIHLALCGSFTGLLGQEALELYCCMHTFVTVPYGTGYLLSSN